MGGKAERPSPPLCSIAVALNPTLHLTRLLKLEDVREVVIGFWPGIRDAACAYVE